MSAVSHFYIYYSYSGIELGEGGANSPEFRSIYLILDLISEVDIIFVLIIIYLAFKMFRKISIKFSSKRKINLILNDSYYKYENVH